MVSRPKFINHYQTLGLLGPTDDRGMIEWAYNLARKIKRPNHSGSNEQQASVELAWKVLSDEKSRAAYLKENQSLFESLTLPIRPPASSSLTQPAASSTRSPDGGSGPPPSSPAAPPSISSPSKRAAGEEHPACSKRPRVSVAHPPSVVWDNNPKEDLKAVFAFIPNKDQARAMAVNAVVTALEDMGTTRSEREAVRQRLSQTGSGAGTVAVSIMEVLRRLR